MNEQVILLLAALIKLTGAIASESDESLCRNSFFEDGPSMERARDSGNRSTTHWPAACAYIERRHTAATDQVRQ